MKTVSMSVSEFMHGKKKAEPAPFSAKVEHHFTKYRFVYKVAGATIIILMSGGAFDYAFAADGIDMAAGKLYREIIGVGKWIIIFKGGIDTIKSVGNGDFDAAKKSFFSYLLTYLFLLGLPFGMDKVDEVFRSINH